MRSHRLKGHGAMEANKKCELKQIEGTDSVSPVNGSIWVTPGCRALIQPVPGRQRGCQIRSFASGSSQSGWGDSSEAPEDKTEFSWLRLESWGLCSMEAPGAQGRADLWGHH